jgi:hypothetical protein
MSDADYSFFSSFFPFGPGLILFFLSSMYAYAGKYIGRYRAEPTRFSMVMVMVMVIVLAMARLWIE